MTDPAPRLPDRAWFALAIIVACGIMYALVSRFALDGFPYSGDEYSIWLQAKLFAHGKLAAPAPSHADWLRVDHVVIDESIRSKYPPGASALLALGEAFGVSWLVTPMEGMLALGVLWFTIRRLLGPRQALIAVVISGLAPLFSFQACTYYTHTASVLFLAIAFAGVAAWVTTERAAWLLLTGSAIGLTYMTRPLDGALFGLAMFALGSRGQRIPWRALCTAGAGAVPFIALNAWYQAAQFGSPLTDGYHAYTSTFIDIYGPLAGRKPLSPAFFFDLQQQWNHLDVMRAFVVDWTVPGALLLALFGAFALRGDPAHARRRRFALTLITIYATLFLFTIADIDEGARPRYLSPLLIPLAYLGAAGFGPASAAITARFGRPVFAVGVTAAIVFALAQLGSILCTRVPQVWTREGLYHAVAEAQLSDAVVLVRAQFPTRYARNGPFFSSGVLFLSAPPDTSADAVAAAFPDRPVWEAHEGAQDVAWKLTKIN